MNRLAKEHGLVAVAVVALLLALLGPQVASAGGPAFSPVEASASSPTDRIIIKYRSGLAGAAAGATERQRATLHHAAQDAGLRAGVQMKLLRLGGFDTHIMKLDRRLAHAEVERIARDIEVNDPNVEYAEADRIMRPMLVPNDTQYGQQWNYFEAAGGLNLPAAWDKSTGAGVVVAVIDTGYRPHADLEANILPGYDMIDSTATANDGNGRDSDAKDPGDAVSAGECGTGALAESSSWHGTHVAGTIAALTNNGSGVAGVAFNAKVLPVRALGKCGGYTSDIADGMIWASGGTVSGLPANPHPARVINMSLGGSGACGTTSQKAIDSARGRGTVVVVAAGNSGRDASDFSPGNCTGVITVAAVNRSGGRAYYSNFGSIVDVAAPGGDVRSGSANGILSTLNSGATAPGADSFAYYQGTSMATPHVAGVVALMLSKNPSLTPDEVETRLKGSTRAFPAACSQCGTGIVDASAAVDAAGGGTAPPAGNEVEPNDSTSTAQAVTQPVTINGTMGSRTDADYFQLTVPSGGSLSATLTPNSNSDYDLYIYKDSTLVASSELGRGAVDSASTTNTGSASATYYVLVLRYSGKTGSAGTYALKLR